MEKLKKLLYFNAMLALVSTGAFLSGCGGVGSLPDPTLSFQIMPDGQTVVFQVKGSAASRYLWQFGDGGRTETTTPQVTYYYKAKEVYTVIVEGIGHGRVGRGGPGPGGPNPNHVVFRIQAVVDLRPAIALLGIKIEPVLPPPWYKPNTPAWPPWHFPAACALKFTLLYKINRPGEVAISSVRWIVKDPWGRLVGEGEGKEWIWLEAQSRFLPVGCPPTVAKYSVRCIVSFDKAPTETLIQEFWACGTGGCR